MTEGTVAQVSSVQTVNSANVSPKKQKKTTTTKGKSTHVATHPKYSEMIKAALKALNDRGGSSRAAILKFVLANYSLDPTQANQHLKLALKNGVKAKYFKQTKGNGASGSFKLASKGEVKPAKKSIKPKKTTSSSTASTATKKRARSKSAGTKPAKKVATAADTNNSAATTSAAAKPKKAKLVKPKTSATPKSDNAAAKPKKVTPAKAKKPTGTKTGGVKKATTATKKVVKPIVKKATTAKKPKSTATKKATPAKKVSKAKPTKKTSPKKPAIK
ncbi:unnamed protein product [Rotaria sp. Silwood2]|nr:unnamed protein product [Rotaria sp. Silwood2]CAF4565999.1 unnamed protein product [Rotaria sp. Silwood2]